MSLGHLADLAAKRYQLRPIIIDAVVLIVSAKFRVQDRPHLAYRYRKLLAEPKPHIAQLDPKLLS